MQTTLTRPPLTICMHADDNVAIVANDGGLAVGTVLPEGVPGAGLLLRDEVPQGHKVALADIAQGAVVRRYNVPIGYALKDIPAGSWVHERLLQMPAARALQGLPGLEVATIKPAPLPPLKATPSRVIATPTARWAHATYWPSPPPCSVWPVWWRRRCGASKPSCCRGTRTWTT